MTRIQIWTDLLWPLLGGIERMTLLMAAAFQARGQDVEIITQQVRGEPLDEVIDGIPVHRLTQVTHANARQIDVIAGNFMRARRQAAEFRPDIRLMMQCAALTDYHQLAQNTFPALTVFSLRGRIENNWASDYPVGRMMRSCDYLVSCSARMLDHARLIMPEITPRSTTILNAMPWSPVAPAPLPWDTPRFLILGRLNYQKNVEGALRAFDQVADRLPHARLTVAGDGREQAEHHALADTLRARDRIDFIGRVDADNVPSVLNQATAVLIPSRFEGLPQVAMQAMQMARPVLASRVDGLPEAVVDGETGFLFDAEDDDALADAMLRVLADRDAAVRMGQAGRQRARALFDWDRYINEYLALFQRLLARP